MTSVKKFITLSCEAIDVISKTDARETYKSIKNNENQTWKKLIDAERALSLKVQLNEEIEELEEELEDNPDDEDVKTMLHDLLSSSSSIELIHELESGFHKSFGSFAQITDLSSVIAAQHTPKLHASHTNEATHDADTEEEEEDEEVFGFAAYMKSWNKIPSAEQEAAILQSIANKSHLSEASKQSVSRPHTNSNSSKSESKSKRERNETRAEEEESKTSINNAEEDRKSQDIKEKEEDDDDDYADEDEKEEEEVDITLKEEDKDSFPVDENANYMVIAQHFKHATTKNKNVDHSVLDLDDLKSIRLRENSSDEEEDEYADSTISYDFTRMIVKKAAVVIKEEESSEEEEREIMQRKKKKNKKKKKKKESSSDDDDDQSEFQVYDSKSAKKKNNKAKAKAKQKGNKKNASKKKGNKKGGIPKVNIKKFFMKKLDEEVEEERGWNKLCESALNDYTWSENECGLIIDEACVLNKKEIFVHSMWIAKCRQYCKQHKNKTKHIKFAVNIGYPSGQTCISAKIGETKYCLKQKCEKIVLFVACGKIISRDWKYIKREVSAIYKVIENNNDDSDNKKVEFHVKHPKTDKINAKTTAVFEETVRKIIEKD